MVAGQDAETTRVEGQALVPAELGTEVGDGALEACAVCAGEPVVAAAGHVVVKRGDDLVDLHEEFGIFEEGLPVNWTRADCNGISCRDPAGFMNAAEECTSLGVPRPPEVVRDATQPLKARWDTERIWCRKRAQCNGVRHQIFFSPQQAAPPCGGS